MSIERSWMTCYVRTDQSDQDVITNVTDAMRNFVADAEKKGLSVDWDSLSFYNPSPIEVKNANGETYTYAEPLKFSVEAVKTK